MADITVHVDDRTVVGAGVVVLPPGKANIAFNVDDLVLAFYFFPEADKSWRKPKPQINPKVAEINLFGDMGALALSWELNVGTYQGKPLTVSLILHSLSSKPGPAVREVVYTFSVPMK